MAWAGKGLRSPHRKPPNNGQGLAMSRGRMRGPKLRSKSMARRPITWQVFCQDFRYFVLLFIYLLFPPVPSYFRLFLGGFGRLSPMLVPRGIAHRRSLPIFLCQIGRVSIFFGQFTCPKSLFFTPSIVVRCQLFGGSSTNGTTEGLPLKCLAYSAASCAWQGKWRASVHLTETIFLAGIAKEKWQSTLHRGRKAIGCPRKL